MVIKLNYLRSEFSAELKKCGLSDFAADLNLIFMNVLSIDKTQLVLGERVISDDELSALRSCIDRLKQGEPVAYIIGHSEFMSLDFIVKKGVLIPRADTEILVEAVIKRLDNARPLSVGDFCCGSGCIGISIAHYLSNALVTFVDISETALEITQKNAEINGVLNRTSLTKADLTESMPSGTFDCVVSNPPYIRSDVIPALDAKVRNFEPALALDGGADGLDFYRRLSKSAPLKNGGLLAFEIGFDQGDAVCEILKQNSYDNIELLKDLENRDRVVLGILKNSL